ncbi:Aste57867_22760 [Aphanomyces stellatus]|uniref:Aste57867_22760 protein n=1 Tax=Aphanomyces stellatus TaxID=120398 RepID=A0A485LMJ0_9STRA|nr:hypothetical protein As57867_022690 [Aphanomyces stellatus]VFT99413.1 Aste57867_22760 [Aphanomyces stellatus]
MHPVESTTTATLAATALCGLLFLSLCWRYVFSKHILDALPGPSSPSLLLGHVYTTYSNIVRLTIDFCSLQTKRSMANWHVSTTYPDPFLSWMTQYGPVVHFRELGAHFVMFSDPKAFQHILVTNGANYPRHPLIRAFSAERMFGVGLFSSEGVLHDQQRTFLQPRFTQARVKSFVPIFERQARHRCDTLFKASTSGTTINMSHVLRELTLQIIGLVAFGLNFNDHPDAQRACEQLNDPLPLWVTICLLFVPKLNYFPHPQLQRVRQAQADLGAVLRGLIDAKLNSAAASDQPLDLLDLCLPTRHETTTAALGWIFVQLAQHPDAVARMRDEVARAMTKHASLASWEAVQDLRFTTAVINESMRLCTITPQLIRRVAAADDHVPLSDGTFVFVPKGTATENNFAAYHRHPKIGPTPTTLSPSDFWMARPNGLPTKHCAAPRAMHLSETRDGGNGRRDRVSLARVGLQAHIECQRAPAVCNSNDPSCQLGDDSPPTTPGLGDWIAN